MIHNKAKRQLHNSSYQKALKQRMFWLSEKITDMVTSIPLLEFTNERKNLIEFLGTKPKCRPEDKPDLELQARLKISS